MASALLSKSSLLAWRSGFLTPFPLCGFVAPMSDFTCYQTTCTFGTQANDEALQRGIVLKLEVGPFAALLCGPSSIDEDVSAGNESGLVRAQEHHQRTYLPHLAPASDRDFCCEFSRTRGIG